MGAAAAWATTQQPIITFATFASIGAGMALPYMLLASFPQWLRRVPRSGASTELIKQVMGLLLLAAGVYFLGAGFAGLMAKTPDPPSVQYWWAVALCIVSAGSWLAWRTYRISIRPVPRTAFIFAGFGMILVGVWLGQRFTHNSPVHWIYFTPARLAKAQNDQKIVVLEFTAAWCLNCHALEQAVLHNPRVVELLNNPKVAAMKVDITGNNPEGNQALIASGRRTIPYLLIYSSDGRQLFASDAYSVNQLITVLRSELSELKARKT
jgi:thiol:disulfide interchange protein